MEDTGNGEIALDDRVREAVEADHTYAVFLQAAGDGVVYVEKKMPDGFICKGTPGLKFDWEVKARQKGQSFRLERPEEPPEARPDYAYNMNRYTRNLMLDSESPWQVELREVRERTVEAW